MFEITPKEQLLKNIRKGLVQPLPNNYPLLNFDKDMLKKPLLHVDETFIKNWVNSGFFFSVYNGSYDLLHQLKNTCFNYQLGHMAIDENQLIKLFTDNEVAFLSIDKMSTTILCSFAKLEIGTDCLYFSSELQPIKHFSSAENIILFGKASQIESPETNKYFSELMIKSDLKVQIPIDYFKSFKNVFLFVEE